MKQSLKEAISPRSLPEILKGYALASKKKKEDILKVPNPPFEVEQPRKDGSTVWTEVIGEVILDHKGKKVGILGISRDISERKKSREVIVKLNETLKLLNKIMRHDIANNLTVTLMSLEMIETENTNLKDKAIRSIYKSVDLIEKMRELENAVSSGGEIKRYDLRVIIENVIKEYKDIKFNISGNCNVLGDNALVSIIDNIVRNAVVHGKTDRIRFDISEDNSNCTLKIADFGVGIPEEIKEKIFDEGFSHGERLSSGLGLFIVKKTIERYGGTINYEKNKPNGSVFVIKLKKAD
jgi:signal transduction histidine kinase